MRTSLNEIKQIENYLLMQSPPAEMIVMESTRLINENLNQNIYCQQQAYEIITLFGAKRLRQEIINAERKVFANAKFKSMIDKIFKK